MCGRQRDLAVVGEAIGVGFGSGFYGFFVAAAAWLVVYFLWAFAAARRDARPGGSGKSGGSGGLGRR